MKYVSIKVLISIVLVCITMNLFTNHVWAQDCSVNAGGNVIICNSSTTLVGSNSGSIVGIPIWTFVSGPVAPIISSPNTLVTEVTGMTVMGDYVFELSQECSDGLMAVSTVTVTARPRPLDFTAGSDHLDVCASVGELTLDGHIPTGYTGEWRAVNIYSVERYSSVVSTNSSFSNTGISTPVFSLINKSNHDIDPAYFVILDIVSDDGICSYSDTAIVRFIPNVEINTPSVTDRCISPDIITPYPHFFYLNSSPTVGPYFSTQYPSVAGSPESGTTVTLNVISQPVGGDIGFVRLDNNIVLLSGVDELGTYVFTLTLSNACGTYTTPNITYNFNGYTPRMVDFQPVGHEEPEQLTIYGPTGSGGELHCDLAGSTDPINFYFSLHPDDDLDIITTANQSGIHPPGGSPTITILGAGTANREVILTAPAGGWNVGTYKIHINASNSDGSCPIALPYFIHISDQNRVDVDIEDVSVCYPGTGAISATINLPPVFKGVVNSSYFQEFEGHYKIEVLSRPAGSATPTYTATNLRSLTSTSTVISNLDKIGDYIFIATLIPYNTSVGPFLDQEFGCSGASLIDTFTIRVEGLVNSNAGSDQVLGEVLSANLAGNDPGLATGEWSIVSAPAGATPTILDINNPLTTVTNLTEEGEYEFSWTITTPYGACVSSDNVVISTLGPPLSVSWIYFEANKINDVAIINWATANENNNLGFEIQKSADGMNWFKLGFVQSMAINGNSKRKIEYSFTDNMPIHGTNYYRLKQIDIDGEFTYSNVEIVNFESLNTIKVFPNPSKGIITLVGLQNESNYIYVMNYTGQRVMEWTLDNQKEHTVDIRCLAHGVYFLTIIYNDGTSSTIKVVKE